MSPLQRLAGRQLSVTRKLLGDTSSRVEWFTDPCAEEGGAQLSHFLFCCPPHRPRLSFRTFSRVRRREKKKDGLVATKKVCSLPTHAAGPASSCPLSVDGGCRRMVQVEHALIHCPCYCFSFAGTKTVSSEEDTKIGKPDVRAYTSHPGSSGG